MRAINVGFSGVTDPRPGAPASKNRQVRRRGLRHKTMLFVFGGAKRLEGLAKMEDDFIDFEKTWGVEVDAHDIGQLTGRKGSEVLFDSLAISPDLRILPLTDLHGAHICRSHHATFGKSTLFVMSRPGKSQRFCGLINGGSRLGDLAWLRAGLSHSPKFGVSHIVLQETI